MIVQCQQKECTHNQSSHCMLDVVNISEFDAECINFVVDDKYKCGNTECMQYNKAYANKCSCYVSITQCHKLRESSK